MRVGFVKHKIESSVSKLTEPQDATEEYNPIHPPGTIEKTLPAGKSTYTQRRATASHDTA